MPDRPSHRRGEAVDRTRERWIRRRKPTRAKGHPKDCVCYDCLWGPEHQTDPDWSPGPTRRG